MTTQTNRLIDALSPESRARLLAVARQVDLPQRTVLYEADEPTQHAYFLATGVASMVVTVTDGGSAEIGMIGNEGVVGAMGLLGNCAPVSSCLMQMNGTALRVSVADLRRLFDESLDIRSRILESVQQQSITLNQIAGCNKLHQASERLARWLLTASDSVGSNTVTLTQESLSQMLGTRRTTVALVAGELQHSGLIRYRRGVIEIINREELAEASCTCYGITRRLVDGLYRGISATH